MNDFEDSVSDNESCGSDAKADDEDCNKKSSPAADTQGSDDHEDVIGDQATQRQKVHFNARRDGFVIDYNADAGLVAMFARKKAKIGCPRQPRKWIKAVVVRKRVTAKKQ